MQEIALDPIASPDAKKAAEAAEFSTLVRKRLRNVIPRLQQKHAATIAQQRRAKLERGRRRDRGQSRHPWPPSSPSCIPQWIAKLLELFQRILVMNAEIEQSQWISPQRRRAPSAEP